MPTFPTVSPLPPDTLDKVAAALQPCVSALHSLHAAAKLAHWNVRGDAFGDMHALFGDVADTAEEHQDAIAEMIPQMGGVVEPFGEMAQPDGAPDWRALAASIGDILRTTLAALQDATDVANEAGDLDTVITLSKASRRLKKLGWMVLAHLDTKENKS